MEPEGLFHERAAAVPTEEAPAVEDQVSGVPVQRRVVDLTDPAGILDDAVNRPAVGADAFFRIFQEEFCVIEVLIDLTDGKVVWQISQKVFSFCSHYQLPPLNNICCKRAGVVARNEDSMCLV